MCRIFSYVICIFFVSLFLCLGCSAIDVSAKSAYAMELDSGDTIFEKNANMQLGMASTTKIMTAIVVIENTKLDNVR